MALHTRPLRLRLRTAMLMTGLVAVVLAVAVQVDRALFAQARWVKAYREARHHALLVGHPPRTIVAERDRLLAVAGPAIRAELRALAERYPQLKSTNHSKLEKDLASPDAPGKLDVSAEHHDGLGGEEPGTLGLGQQFVFRAILFEDSLTPSSDVQQQQPPALLFPHLHLWGYRDAWAGDGWLDSRLKEILDRHLAPLKALEARAASLPAPAPET